MRNGTGVDERENCGECKRAQDDQLHVSSANSIIVPTRYATRPLPLLGCYVRFMVVSPPFSSPLDVSPQDVSPLVSK